ncbi:MAG: glycosyltransferase [Lachnospiraceae bacterium]|nr:glycosyltransferase [Lachnospiraceae bacterium]
MTKCKISIVMPVYNVERYLRMCLDSILNQTFKDFEIIIVNDGSTDGSLSILKEYEQNYSDLIKVYTTENRGVSHARNYGIERAKGEYLLFVDSDDFLEPDMCEKLYEKASRDNNDIVICKYFDAYVNEQTGKITKKRSKAYNIAIGRNFDIHDTKFELTHISPFPWDKLYRRTLFDNYKFPENMRFEDLAVVFPIVCTTNSIGVIEDRLYNYRRGSAGSFLSSFSEGTLDIVKALQMVVESVKKQGQFEMFYEEIEYICIRHFLIRYNALFDVKTKGKLAVKKEMINKSLDFLEAEFPNWRENRYLKYTASRASKAKMKKYTSREKMLRVAVTREYLPVICVKIGRKGMSIIKKCRDKVKAFNKIKNKKKYIKQKLPFLKLFKLPRDVRYTRFYEKFPVNENDVLFESKHGEDVAGNVFQMILAMKEEKYRKFHIMLTLKSSKRAYYEAMLKRYGIDYVDIIPTDSNEYLKTLATTKYLITDTSFPPYFIKKPEQVYLNTWHGTPLKAMGRIVPNREYALGNVQRNYFMADYLLYQNEFSRDCFVGDYMLEGIYNGKIMLSGYPRNSAFFNTDRYDIIRNELGLDGMQVIAYMPTWRGLLDKKENKKQVQELYNYFYDIDMQLNDDQVMYVKLHPYVKSGVDYNDFDHIKPFPEEYETYDFLNATDMLVSDYSSIMFDYAVSKKKIVLFTYDREQYLADRGMYLDLNEMEFPKADTVDELIREINRESSYPKFFEEYCKYDHKTCAKDVCDVLFFNEEPKFKMETIKHDGKKNVLIFINGLKKNAAAEELVERLNALDTSKYNYYLCFKAATVKKATSVLAGLKREINYIPMMFDVNYTIKDRLACAYVFKYGRESAKTEALINHLAAREKDKYFNSIHFDIVINLSTSDKIINHMFKSFEGKKVYNFKSFNLEKYESNAQYKKRVDYIAKRFDFFDLIVGNEDMMQLECDAFKNGTVKVMTDAEPKLQFEEVLKEVDR